jgi:ribosomal protein L37AE/L43A
MSNIYIIKENLTFGEDYLSYTIDTDASGCYGVFTETSAEGNITKLNSLLEERYGIVKKDDGIKPVYEIVNLKAGIWHCDKCGVSIIQNKKDYSRFSLQKNDGDIMGELFRYDFSAIVQTMKLLDSGECPVCEGWNDGIGNTCSPSGWGKTEFFFKNCKLITKPD